MVKYIQEIWKRFKLITEGNINIFSFVVENKLQLFLFNSKQKQKRVRSLRSEMLSRIVFVGKFPCVVFL